MQKWWMLGAMNMSTLALSLILFCRVTDQIIIRNMIVQAYRWPSHLWSLLRLINYRGEESGWLIGTTRILFRLRFFGYHSCRWKQHFPPCPRQQTSPLSHISVHLIIFFWWSLQNSTIFKALIGTHSNLLSWVPVWMFDIIFIRSSDNSFVQYNLTK